MSGPSLTAAINALNRANKVLRSKTGSSSTHGAPEDLRKGVRNGVSLQVKASSKFDKRTKLAQQHEPLAHQVGLAERRPSTDALDNILSPDEIHGLASTVPNYRPLLMRATQRILRGERHQDELPEGSDGATLEMAAYHLALHCLSPEGDAKSQRDRLTALLTPIEPHQHDPQTLFSVFQNAVDPDDEEQETLVNLLIQLKGGGARIEDPRKAAKDLCRPGSDGSEAVIDDSDQLMAWLRQVLNLTALTTLNRSHRRETVLNDLADFRASSRGGIVAKLLAQRGPAGPSVAPPQLADREAAEDHDPDFLDRLSDLLNKFSFEQLQAALNDNKRRSGEKLPQNPSQAEAPAVRDPELGATLKELGDLHVASTLVMFVKNTLDFFRRTGRGTLDGTVLLRELLVCLQAQPQEAGHYQHLLGSAGVTALEAQIVLLTSLKNVVQNLPAKCFASNEARLKALGAVQAALDPLVNAEEEPAAEAPETAAEAR